MSPVGHEEIVDKLFEIANGHRPNARELGKDKGARQLSDCHGQIEVAELRRGHVTRQNSIEWFSILLDDSTTQWREHVLIPVGLPGLPGLLGKHCQPCQRRQLQRCLLNKLSLPLHQLQQVITDRRRRLGGLGLRQQSLEGSRHQICGALEVTIQGGASNTRQSSDRLHGNGFDPATVQQGHRSIQQTLTRPNPPRVNIVGIDGFHLATPYIAKITNP